MKKKYQVLVTRSDWGYLTVNAENEEKAIELAWENYAEDTVYWKDGRFDIESAEELSA